MPDKIDKGGIWALAGFLYQIIGMLSYVEVLEISNNGSSGNSEEALLVLKDVGKSIQARHEDLAVHFLRKGKRM